MRHTQYLPGGRCFELRHCHPALSPVRPCKKELKEQGNAIISDNGGDMSNISSSLYRYCHNPSLPSSSYLLLPPPHSPSSILLSLPYHPSPFPPYSSYPILTTRFLSLCIAPLALHSFLVHLPPRGSPLQPPSFPSSCHLLDPLFLHFRPPSPLPSPSMPLGIVSCRCSPRHHYAYPLACPPPLLRPLTPLHAMDP